MAQQEWSLDEYLIRGLRPHADIPRNAKYMERFTNLMACERRAKQLPAFTWPAGFPTPGPSWPPAEAHFDERVALSVVEQEFYTLNPSALTSSQIEVYQATGGTSVLANGNFASDTLWDKGAGWSIAAGVATAATASSALKQLKADMSTPWTSAIVYEVTFTITRSAGSLTIGTNTNANQGATYADSGTYTALVTADAHADGLVFTGTGFSGTIDNVSATATYTVQGTGSWHMAAFLDMWLATNGSSIVYKLPSSPDNKVVGYHGITCNSLCNWDNRLVFAGLASASHFSSASWTRFFNLWQIRDKNVVTSEDDVFDKSWLLIGPRVGGDPGIPMAALMALLGAPSDTVYTTVYESKVLEWAEQGEIDLFPCRFTGEILCVREYEGDLIVFGVDGVSRVRRTEAGLYEERIGPVGIWGRASVGGTSRELACVGKDGNIYMTGEAAMRYANEGVYAPERVGTQFFRLGFAEFIATLNNGTRSDFLMVLFDPTEHRYWFSAGDGSYLLSKTGLSHSLGIIPSAALRFPGSAALIGTAKTDISGALAVVLRTVAFDLGRRDPFNVGRIDLTTTDTASSEADRWKARAKAKLRKQDAMRTFPDITADVRGVATVDLIGIEHQYEFRAADRTKVDLDGAIAWIDPPGKNPSMRKWLTVEGL